MERLLTSNIPMHGLLQWIPAFLLGCVMFGALCFLALRPVPGQPVALLFPTHVALEDRLAVIVAHDLTLLDTRLNSRMLIVSGLSNTSLSHLNTLGEIAVIRYRGLVGCGNADPTNKQRTIL